MKKWMAGLFAIVLGIGALAQSAGAAERPHAHAAKLAPPLRIGPFDLGDPYVFAGGVIAGVGTSGAYLAIEDKRSLEFGSHAHHHGGINGGAFALTTIGCMALSPMLAAAFVYIAEGRELSQREALGLGADCIVPILGSFLWNAAYRAHPEWPGQ
jgi:hypothetical protein